MKCILTRYHRITGGKRSVLGWVVAALCTFCVFAVSLHAQSLTWKQSIQLGNVNKVGLGALDSADYQYDVIGLGGTTLRVGTYGFTSGAAPNVTSAGAAGNFPFLEYEYWWDENEYRQAPFGIFGGYDTTYHNIQIPTGGTITSFSHHLDISNGTLTTDLGLEVGGTNFTTHRSEFVTPSGVWIVRVADSGATQPFQLTIGPAAPSDGISYTYSVTSETNGLVVTATASNASTASLAVAWQGNATYSSSAAGYSVTAAAPNDTLTFFIAPSSSFTPNITNPTDAAWNLAQAAQAIGYTSELQATQSWWNEFWARSDIDLPSSASDLAGWYTRSLYYHGAYFGNTAIPTGLWGTCPAPGGGNICPEFDLVFSDLALLYSNHTSESGNIVNWIKQTLPQAQKNATSTNIYSFTINHNWGATYGWWVGYDGKFIIMGDSAAEVADLREDFPSANCALMATKQADFTMNPADSAFADSVLVQTTKIQVDDQIWDGTNYVNTNSASSMNQDGCIYGLSQCVARGLADSAWTAILPKVLLPQAIWINPQGRRYPVLVGGAGGSASQGASDAPQLWSVWPYDIVAKNSALVPPTFQLVSLSNTASYTFNRGTMSVIASKIHDANDAYNWALSLTSPDVAFDDAAICESSTSTYAFQRTPETAAHGALICSVIQMLVDPDNNDPIDVFPAIPASWWSSGVSFKDILVKGGIEVSGSITGANVTVSLTNINSVSKNVNLHVWLPSGTTSLSQYPTGTVVENGYATLSDSLKGYGTNTYNFVLGTTPVKIGNNGMPTKFALSQNYPNPFNPSTKIAYDVPEKALVTIEIYNVLGQNVATLVEATENPGRYVATFDGSQLASGVYLCRMTAGSYSSTIKLVMLK